MRFLAQFDIENIRRKVCKLYLLNGEKPELPDHPSCAAQLRSHARAAGGYLVEHRGRERLRDESGLELDCALVRVRDHAGDGDPEEELLGLDAGEVADGAVGEGTGDGLVVVDEVGAEVDIAGAREVDLEAARGLVEGVGGDGVRDEPLREAVLGKHVVRRAVQRPAACLRRRGDGEGGGEGEEEEAPGRHGRWWVWDFLCRCCFRANA